MTHPALSRVRQPRHSPSSTGLRRYARSPLLGGIELLTATYHAHHFPRHAQENVVFGLVDEGTINVLSEGRSLHVGESDVLFIAPGTVHEAFGVGDAIWTYRALYLTPAQWEGMCRDLGAVAPGGAAVIHDAVLHQRVKRSHARLLEDALTEQGLAQSLREIVGRVIDAVGESRREVDGTEVGVRIERVRRALDVECTRRIPLREMAAIAGLSTFHFLRAFTRAYGVSPCAYSLNRRLLEAQRRLSDGAPISTTAFEFGFADQAHLTRHFLRTIGVTPGEYQRAFGGKS